MLTILVQAMESTLRDESDRWLREKDRRRRHGEPKGIVPTILPVTRSKDNPGSYEQLAEQELSQTSRRYAAPVDMDLDDDDYRQAPIRHRDAREIRDPRDRDMMEPPRPVASGRIPVSTGYPPEPGYTAAQYAISSQQQGYIPGQPQYYGSEREPRTFNGGNTTPPTSAISRTAQPGGYGQPGYITRTGPPVSQSIPASYDSRSRDIMGGAYSGYPESRSTRR